MSKKVAILEGDKSRRFGGVKYLRTDLVGGGYCEWVPEDEKELTTKTIKKNGTYKASDEKNKKTGGSYYGFSQVTVSVPADKKKKKSGKKRSDGNEYSVGVDDNGNITETPIPSRINITTNPSKMSYADGQSISFSGGVVKAYMNDGTLWGTVPNGELTLDPTKADMSKGSGSPDSTATISDTTGLNQDVIVNMPIPYKAATALIWIQTYQSGSKGTNTIEITSAGSPVYALVNYLPSTGTRGITVFSASTYEGIRHETIVPAGGGEAEHYTNAIHPQGTAHINGKPVYFSGISAQNPGMGLDINLTEWNPNGAIESNQAAYIVLYGTRKEGEVQQPITVKWNRPEDSKTLTDTYTIAVKSISQG